jgi:hypothetical protein
VVKTLTENLEAMEGVENGALEAQVAGVLTKHKERTVRNGKAILETKVAELQKASVTMSTVVNSVVGQLGSGGDN